MVVVSLPLLVHTSLNSDDRADENQSISSENSDENLVEEVGGATVQPTLAFGLLEAPSDASVTAALPIDPVQTGTADEQNLDIPF